MDVVLKLRVVTNKIYELKIGDSTTYKAVLVSPSMMLAGSYVLKMDNGNNTTIYLDGERIRKVKFSRIKQ